MLVWHRIFLESNTDVAVLQMVVSYRCGQVCDCHIFCTAWLWPCCSMDCSTGNTWKQAWFFFLLTLITCQTVYFQPTAGWLIETNKYLQWLREHGDQHANIKRAFCVHNPSLEIELKETLSIILAYYFILIEFM